MSCVEVVTLLDVFFFFFFFFFLFIILLFFFDPHTLSLRKIFVFKIGCLMAHVNIPFYRYVNKVVCVHTNFLKCWSFSQMTMTYISIFN